MKICVIGSNGQLGRHLFNKYKNNKQFFFFSSSLNKSPFLKGDLTKPKQLIFLLNKIKPNIIINCSAYTNVDKAELEKKKANHINFKAVQTLSKYCFKNNIILIYFSTDYVYSGYGNLAWKENSNCNPINYYGNTKLRAEKTILKSKCKFIILRLSWLYGKFGEENFIIKIIKLAKLKKKLFMVKDQHGSPTSTDLVIFVLEKILIKIKKKKLQSGIFNLCPSLNTNRYDLSKYILRNYFDKTFYKKLQITKIRTKDLNLVALRPLNSRMEIYKISSFLNIKIKNWKYYLKKYLNYIKRNT